MKPLFIAIEGIDGTGKSTLAKRLVPKLELATHGMLRPIRTHEPSSPQMERTIRDYFKRDGGPPPPEVMSILFTADRLLHLEEKVKPALAAGSTVITDRHKLSTLVYQEVNGCDPKVLKALCDVPSPNPDITIILDIDPKVALQRMVERNPNLDAYEKNTERQVTMRRLYKQYSSKFGLSVIVDADRDENELADHVTSIILDMT